MKYIFILIKYSFCFCLISLFSCEQKIQDNYDNYVLPAVDELLCEEAKNMNLELNTLIIEDESVHEIVLSKSKSDYYSKFYEKTWDWCPLQVFLSLFSFDNNLEDENNFGIEIYYSIGIDHLKYNDVRQYFFVYYYWGENRYEYLNSNYGNYLLDPNNPTLCSVAFGYFYEESQDRVKIIFKLTTLKTGKEITFKIYYENGLSINN